MKRFQWLVGCLAVAAAVASPARAASDAASRIKANLEFLANDDLEGREADARGYRIAARYVASQFAQLGLKPAASDGSYLQPVRMIAYRPADKTPIRISRRNEPPLDLEFGKDFLPEAIASSGSRAFDAPLVFAGYGIVAPEWKRDDFAGLDVRGKIVVVLSGAPKKGSGDEQAFFSSTTNKRIAAAKRGAVGVMTISAPDDEKRQPLSSSASRRQVWRMAWRGTDGRPFDAAPRAPLLARLSSRVGEKLFAGSNMSWSNLVARLANGPIAPRVAELGWRISGRQTSETRETLSWNVAGILPGRDSALSSHFVALTAHLDHLGVLEGEGGRKVYNGAQDNAAGVATMLEVARSFRQSDKQPRRSLLFVAITAEEKGLVGSEYLAHNPLVPNENIDALVNLDMPILTYDFKSVVAFGAEHSTIGPVVDRVASRLGIGLVPDPLPEEGIFTRSDHYRFVQKGVPSIFLMTGFEPGSSEHFTRFLSTCYHQPCDDLAQPIDYTVAAKFARLNYEIASELANSSEAPRWNSGDFFGRRYGGNRR